MQNHEFFRRHIRIVIIAGCLLAMVGIRLASAARTPPPRADGKTRHMVTFGLLDEASVGALQFEVRYGSFGRFVGDARDVECKSLLPETASAMFNHKTGELSLRSGWYSALGFKGPTDLAECVFEHDASLPLAGEQFRIVVNLISAVTPSRIDPFPRVGVTKIRRAAPSGEQLVFLPENTVH